MLYRPLEKADGRWFPDGGAISAYIRAEPDTMVLLRPDGLELARRVSIWEELTDRSHPCGPSGTGSTALRWVEGVLELVTWDWSSDVVEMRWRAGLPLVFSFQCSPLVGAAAAVVRLQGVNRLMTVDLVSGDTLLGPAVPIFTNVAWLPKEA